MKKIDSASLSLYEEDNFLEVVSNISRLRHPNIVPLTGYCVEHGQRLLVYEYIGNGTLHDILHFSDDGTSKKLTWNTRVRIALGTARALEYVMLFKKICYFHSKRRLCYSGSIVPHVTSNSLGTCMRCAYPPWYTGPSSHLTSCLMKSTVHICLTVGLLLCHRILRER